MIRRYKSAWVIAALFSAGFAAQAQSMGAAEYATAKDRIKAEYRSAKTACDRLRGNAQDVCEEEAEGKEKVARAELDYARSGRPEDAARIRVVKADVAYEIAEERCEDSTGAAQAACERQAKAVHTKALADAKMNRKVSEARRDAMQDRREADYKLAADKCDALAGDAKSACIAAAKARYQRT